MAVVAAGLAGEDERVADGRGVGGADDDGDGVARAQRRQVRINLEGSNFLPRTSVSVSERELGDELRQRDRRGDVPGVDPAVPQEEVAHRRGEQGGELALDGIDLARGIRRPHLQGLEILAAGLLVERIEDGLHFQMDLIRCAVQ